MRVPSRLTAALGAAVLSAALFATPFMPTAAHAQIGGCRSDPTVTLSNLAVVDLSASINDSLSDVRSVTYVLHVPKGVFALATVKTDTLIGLTEHFQIVSDQPAGTYKTYTTVYTGASSVAVTANTVVLGLLSLSVGLPSASGFNGQTLYTYVKPLL
jgi:hypothetical protein